MWQMIFRSQAPQKLQAVSTSAPISSTPPGGKALYQLLLLATDAAALAAATFILYLLDIERVSSSDHVSVALTNSYIDSYLALAASFVMVSIAFFVLLNSYAFSTNRSFWRATFNTSAVLSLVILLMGIAFISTSRDTKGIQQLVILWAISNVLIAVNRKLTWQLVRNFLPFSPVAIVSSMSSRSIPNKQEYGVLPFQVEASPGESVHGRKTVQKNADEILFKVSLDSLSGRLSEQVVEQLTGTGPVRIVLQPPQGRVLQEVRIVENAPTLLFAPKRLPWEYEVVKRIFDVLMASIGLVISAPIMLLIALAIKLESPGPVFFRQARIGRYGRNFQMVKFRSMYRDAEERLKDLLQQNEAQGPMFKIRNDPRVTRVGKIIRRLSLDELPQFFNVLEGSMSLVGPRPPLPREVTQYESWQRRRLEAVPGITGLWQVSHGPTISFDDAIFLDLKYIENWSLWLELKILLKTIPALLGVTKGAY